MIQADSHADAWDEWTYRIRPTVTIRGRQYYGVLHKRHNLHIYESYRMKDALRVCIEENNRERTREQGRG